MYYFQLFLYSMNFFKVHTTLIQCTFNSYFWNFCTIKADLFKSRLMNKTIYWKLILVCLWNCSENFYFLFNLHLMFVIFLEKSFFSEAIINWILLEKEMLLLLLLHSIVNILKLLFAFYLLKLLITFYSENPWQTAHFKFKF